MQLLFIAFSILVDAYAVGLYVTTPADPPAIEKAEADSPPRAGFSSSIPPKGSAE